MMEENIKEDTIQKTYQNEAVKQLFIIPLSSFRELKCEQYKLCS